MCDVFINKRAPGGRHRGAPEGRQEKSVGRPFHMCVLSLRAAAVRVTHHHQQPTRLPICVASFAEQTARSFALLSLSCLSSSPLEILPPFPRCPQCARSASCTSMSQAEDDRWLPIDTVPAELVGTSLQLELVVVTQSPWQCANVQNITSHTAYLLLREY